MQWINALFNELWYTEGPTPGVILFDGTQYNLTMGAIPGYLYQTYSVQDAQNQYVIQATSFLVTPIVLNTQLPSLDLPNDRDTVLVTLIGGGFASGTWNAGNQTLNVDAQTVPITNIATWAELVQQ